MADTLESLIEREFQEVRKTREDLLARRAEIDEQLAALDLRLKAAENYKATLQGKFSPPARASKTPSKTPRSPRAELREKIIDTIRQFPNGLAAEGLNTELEANNPKDRQRIANLLSLLKSEGVLLQEQRRGPYKIAPPQRKEFEAPGG